MSQIFFCRLSAWFFFCFIKNGSNGLYDFENVLWGWRTMVMYLHTQNKMTIKTKIKLKNLSGCAPFAGCCVNKSDSPKPYHSCCTLNFQKKKSNNMSQVYFLPILLCFICQHASYSRRERPITAPFDRTDLSAMVFIMVMFTFFGNEIHTPIILTPLWFDSRKIRPEEQRECWALRATGVR